MRLATLVQYFPRDEEELTFLESLTESLTSSDFWFQMLVLVGLAPIWYPILRAIYRELNRSLRAEGGVFGREITDVEKKRLAALDETDPHAELPLKSLPRGPRDARASASASAPARSAPAPGRAGRPLRASRGRGF